MEKNLVFFTTSALLSRLHQKGALDLGETEDCETLTNILLATEDEDTVQHIVAIIPPDVAVDALLQIAISSQYKWETCVTALIRLIFVKCPIARDDALIDIERTAEHESMRNLTARIRIAIREQHIRTTK